MSERHPHYVRDDADAGTLGFIVVQKPKTGLPKLTKSMPADLRHGEDMAVYDDAATAQKRLDAIDEMIRGSFKVQPVIVYVAGISELHDVRLYDPHPPEDNEKWFTEGDPYLLNYLELPPYELTWSEGPKKGERYTRSDHEASVERRLAARVKEIEEPNTFSMRVELGTDNMCDPHELAAALERVAERLRQGEEVGTVADVNGLVVGEFIFSFKVG